jgi:Family of unknown function (DUF5683)
MRKIVYIFILIHFCFFSGTITAQTTQGGFVAEQINASDSIAKKKGKKFDPRIATRRSAMIPGWGQIYNKKYWKLPLIYGGLGITVSVFKYNVENYNLLRLAYMYKIDTISANDVLIDPRFKNLSANALRSYRTAFRQNVDYTVLFFIAFWGLNVVDATVDSHLKAFDVNDNLSLQLKQGYSQMANTAGLSLVLDIHSKKMYASK